MVLILHFKSGVSFSTVKGEISMELLLLAKVGFVVDTIVRAGYVLAGSYFVKTGVRYIQDYKDSISNEKAGVK